MKAISVILGVLTLLILMPIWYYLMYKLLETSHATDLMWFLFWVYLPLHLLAAVISKIVEAVGK